MDITVLDSGFVTLDSIKPVGYAGEMNSRQLNITHPLFKDCYYQLLIMRGENLYTLGVENGTADIPASLLRTAGTLNCQFVAMSSPNSITNSETDTFVFKSNSFKLSVAKGLNTGNNTAIPPYEQLQDIYKNINEAKAEVDKAKQDNEKILQAIRISLDKAKQAPVVDLEEEFRKQYEKQLEEISNNYFDEFVNSIADEVMRKIEETYPIHDCSNCCNNQPTTPPACPEINVDKLRDMIKQIISNSLVEIKSKCNNSDKPSHSMSINGNIIGG